MSAHHPKPEADRIADAALREAPVSAVAEYLPFGACRWCGGPREEGSGPYCGDGCKRMHRLDGET